MTCGNSQLRYNILCRWYTYIASEGAQHNEDYLMLIEEAKKLQKRLHSNAAAREGRKGSSDEAGEQSNPNAAEPSAAPVQPKPRIQIHDPTVATAKGRPRGTGRMKSVVEGIFTKQQITCSHCGSHDHNIATCALLHLDRSEIQKQKRTKHIAEKGCAQDKRSQAKEVQKKVGVGRPTRNIETSRRSQNEDSTSAVRVVGAEQILHRMNLEAAKSKVQVNKEKPKKKK